MICSIAAIAWFGSWIVGLPETVGLAAVATIAYLFGRRSRPAGEGSPTGQAEQELKQAAAIAQDLERIAGEVRKDLAAHHSSVIQFKSKLDVLGSSGEGLSSQALYAEAERMLTPTLKLAAQLSHAYDQIRQQSTQLLAFSEARTDALTQVGNRRALDEQLNLLFGLLSRHDRPFSLAIFDIDHFKDINDRKGRAAGDQLLRDVAGAFKQSVRETDFCARYGGEEFVVIMPQTRLTGASVFAERLRCLMEETLSCTVSGGVAEANPQDTAQKLLTRADSALYSAKASGRNAVYQHNGTAIRRVERESGGPRRLGRTESAPPDATSEASAAALHSVERVPS